MKKSKDAARHQVLSTRFCNSKNTIHSLLAPRSSALILLLISAFCLLTITGCFGQTSVMDAEDIVLEQQVDPSMDITEETDMRYIGMWERAGTWVNGEAMDTGIATLVLKENWFDSYTAICSAAGGLEAEGNALTMKYVASDCPGEVLDSLVYTYAISEDGNTMDFSVYYAGSLVEEQYTRAIQE